MLLKPVLSCVTLYTVKRPLMVTLENQAVNGNGYYSRSLRMMAAETINAKWSFLHGRKLDYVDKVKQAFGL